VRHPVRALLVSTLAIGLFASGCSKNTGNGGGGTTPSAEKSDIVIDYKGDVKGPAKAPAGAKPGGTLRVLTEADFDHLDPQQEYVSDALAYGQLFHRTLTQYIEDPEGDGPLQLVGDLATSAGETTDNGKTWKYTLRDGIKFDDGTPITSADVAYGVARSFSDYGVQGPQYLQNALDPTRAYKGPYTGQLLPPGVATPDAKTIIFTFDKPHAEVPYLLEFPTSTPVPQTKDTKDQYDVTFVSSGPYRTKEYKKDVSLTLEKNPNWDANSDPIRTQYADQIVFDFTVDAQNQTNRLKAASGDDATAVMAANVPPAQIAEVKGDPDVMKRVVASPTPFVTYLYINTSRVTDVDVRRALNYAFDRDAYIKAVGGFDVADPASTLMAKVVPGWKNYDAYPGAGGSLNGDVEKAKALLAGKTVPKLKYCFPNTATNQTVAGVNSNSLSRAGFTFTLNPITAADYYTTVGDKTTDCDLINGGWGQDWPDGESTLGVLWDGSLIVDKGNQNLSYFNDPGIVAKLKTLRELTDRSQAAAQYGDLDEQIMKDFAPVIPLRYLRNFSIYGPNVGGTWVSPLFAHFMLVTAYVK
jgi:peptide/nickel transport system substrate-binding protein